MNFILKNEKGRAIYAAQSYLKGELIEICPVIFTLYKSKEDPLFDYVFQWSDDYQAIALGHGSIYNHSFNPNAKYIKDINSNTIIINAYIDIKIGEEITINYNGDPEDKTLVWFSVKN
jgi:hypothetical protein